MSSFCDSFAVAPARAAAFFLAGAVLAAPLTVRAQAPTTTTVVVLPYQPILRSVSADKVRKATDHLIRELRRSQSLKVVVAGKASDPTTAGSLKAASDLAEQADKAEQNKNIVEAIERRRAAVAALEDNVAAMDEPERYVRALHRLARALMWSGADKPAREVMTLAARIAPYFSLPPARYSRLYRRWFADEAQRVLREQPGTLVVRSQVPGAIVRLDGRKMDAAPIRIRKVIPGRHWIRATVQGVAPYGRFVELSPGSELIVDVDFGDIVGGAAVGESASALAQNRLPAMAVNNAAIVGEQAGARLVILGGLAADRVEKDFNVHTFVVNVSTKTVAVLLPVSFDESLLTAESDVIGVVEQIEEVARSFPTGVANVEQIEPQTAGFATSNVIEVDGSPPRNAGERRAGRQVVRPRRVFKAAKKDRVEIEDE